MGTPAERSSSNTLYYTRGDLIPGLQVNGMDVLAVMAAVKFSKEWTQSGKGPLILEMVTYRYGGHSMSDPGTTYRTREEIQHMRSANDPITGLKQRMLEWGIVSEDELKTIDKDVRKSVDDAVEEAKQSPEPEAHGDEMWRDSRSYLSHPYGNSELMPSLQSTSRAQHPHTCVDVKRRRSITTPSIKLRASRLVMLPVSLSSILTQRPTPSDGWRSRMTEIGHL